jgi:hypothetical protein
MERATKLLKREKLLARPWPWREHIGRFTMSGEHMSIQEGKAVNSENRGADPQCDGRGRN